MSDDDRNSGKNGTLLLYLLNTQRVILSRFLSVEISIFDSRSNFSYRLLAT